MEQKKKMANRFSSFRKDIRVEEIQSSLRNESPENFPNSNQSLQSMGYYFHKDEVDKFQKYLKVGDSTIYSKVYKFCLELINNPQYLETILGVVKEEK